MLWIPFLQCHCQNELAIINMSSNGFLLLYTWVGQNLQQIHLEFCFDFETYKIQTQQNCKKWGVKTGSDIIQNTTSTWKSWAVLKKTERSLMAILPDFHALTKSLIFLIFHVASKLILEFRKFEFLITWFWEIFYHGVMASNFFIKWSNVYMGRRGSMLSSLNLRVIVC